MHATEYCHSAFTRTEGYHIAHENTRTFLVETWEDCASWCCADSQCQSFDYKQLFATAAGSVHSRRSDLRGLSMLRGRTFLGVAPTG